MPYLQQHLRLFRPAFFLSVQEIVEETQLLLAPIVGVEMCPVLNSMGLQPFLPGGGAHVSFEIATRVQSLAAPIGSGKQRRDDLVPLCRSRPMIVVVHRMRRDLGAEVGAVSREF